MYRTIRACGHSDAQFVKALKDEIRNLGAMDQLISDRAQAEISSIVKDVLRSMMIRGWQSTPHNKNQNFGERGWKDTKQKSNNLLNYSTAPKKC